MRLLQVFHCLIFSLLLTACDTGDLPTIRNGDPAPAFTLERLDGSPLRFPEQYRGQVVALRFWADWCPYCYGEMKALEPVYRRRHKEGLVILAVNVMQPPETVRRFVDELGLSYEIALDRQGEVMRLYQVMGLPVTLIIDRQGAVRSRILGESSPEVFEQAIAGWL
ncbi:MAG: TlpA family protein disulfide reductase [Candidatus Competibacteraceae bacterium]|nr:TlpA family protein disulfide reductase [Candidatus Competibacteraceae bacterium]